MIDTRRLSHLVDQWFDYHGSQLKDAKYRYSRTLAICTRLNNPLAADFQASDFSKYRVNRLKQVSKETVNHETRYLRSVFNELIRLGFWTSGNPLSKIRTYKIPEVELSFLSRDQERKLLSACEESKSSHLVYVVRLCLVTGARWGEANGLLHAGLFDDRVRYANTKNGRIRVLPVNPILVKQIRGVSLDATKNARVFSDCRSAFRRALKKSGIVLPAGQMTHVLRHTFASRVLMGGGDLGMLQKALGHSDPKTTMRYAHLSTQYMEGLRRFFD